MGRANPKPPEPKVGRPPADFLRIWERWYPDAPPIGFLLRKAYGERWLRIHSLPKSKRYATTERERREILRRHNTVANDMFGLGTPCVVTLWDYCRRDVPARLRRAAGLDVTPYRIGRLPERLWYDEEGCFGCPMCIYGYSVVWRPGVLDGFILAVADEKITGVVVNMERAVVYAPYDGGADLIYRSPADRREAHRSYADWLSNRPDGL